MNSSGNLISLSDSGAGTTLSGSLIHSRSNGRIDLDSSDCFGLNMKKPKDDVLDGMGDAKASGTAGEAVLESSRNEILIDLSDEVQVPVPQGILLQAEIDDTFGIFSMAKQSSQGGSSGEKGGSYISNDDDEAAKLVRSFTSGRKSDEIKTKEKKTMDNSDNDNKNNSADSIASDQPTIVDSEPDGTFSPTLPNIEDSEKIGEEKRDRSSSSNLSVGSDSEILDVGNLSSFSIPDEDLDENKFIEDIKREDMANAATAAVVNKIKLELLQDEDDASEIDGRACRADDKYDGVLSEVSRPSLASSTRTMNRISTSSVTSRSSRWSTCTQKNSTVLEIPMTSVISSSSNSNASTSTVASRSRLSSGNFGSPIRASYPISNRYFMPTPKAKTPSVSRDDYRDRLSESLSSPSRTRVILITGDSYRSPTRAPTRRSISAETLHYEHNSPVMGRDADSQRHVIKFSTPSASRSRARHSVSIHSGMPNFPNIFGDDRPETLGGKHTNNPYIYGGDEITTNKVDFVQHRNGRLSYASSTSNSSIHTLSPTNSSMREEHNCPMEVHRMTSQLNRINLNDSSNTSRESGVQPVRATAIIAPTNLSKPNIKPSVASMNTDKKVKLNEPSKLKVSSSGQRPIAASSPNTAAGRPACNQTTPSRSRYGINVRSSGYGPQQNLNTTFGTNQPLKSPNKATSTGTSIKPPAILKSLKPGIQSFGTKLELGTRGGGSAVPRSGVTALKPGGKLPAPGTIGLRRPATSTTTSSSAASGSNKENKIRPGSTTATSRIGVRQPHRQ